MGQLEGSHEPFDWLKKYKFIHLSQTAGLVHDKQLSIQG